MEITVESVATIFIVFIKTVAFVLALCDKLD
jgi:hypothetical protein